jgi:hypothetical protein
VSVDEGEKPVAHTFFDTGDTRLLCAGRDGGLVERGVLGGTGMVSDCLVGSDCRHCDGWMAAKVCREEICKARGGLLVSERRWRQAGGLCCDGRECGGGLGTNSRCRLAALLGDHVVAHSLG